MIQSVINESARERIQNVKGFVQPTGHIWWLLTTFYQSVGEYEIWWSIIFKVVTCPIFYGLPEKEEK